FRWPTMNMEVNALYPGTGGTQDVFRDPLDPTGTLLAYNRTTRVGWWNSPQRQTFERLLHSVSDPQLPTPAPLNSSSFQPMAYHAIPVVVSWGRNQKLGITRINQASNPDPMPDGGPDSFDNLYSFRLR